MLEDTGVQAPAADSYIRPFEGKKENVDGSYMTPFKHPPESELDIVDKTKAGL